MEGYEDQEYVVNVIDGWPLATTMYTAVFFWSHLLCRILATSAWQIHGCPVSTALNHTEVHKTVRKTSSGRAGKQQQEQTSPNLERTILCTSVVNFSDSCHSRRVGCRVLESVENRLVNFHRLIGKFTGKTVLPIYW